jgi:hypothetical protein
MKNKYTNRNWKRHHLPKKLKKILKKFNYQIIKTYKNMDKLNLIREIMELKTHLSYSKNIGFFFGAGTSCALKIPNVEQLTSEIEKILKDDFKKNFDIIKKDLETFLTSRKVNIEDILNHVRRIRDITGESTKDYQGVSGEAAKKLDKEICTHIYNIILEKEKAADLNTTKKFFSWLNILNREFSKEVFTTNYDLIIEKSLEISHIPYFDGFVGAYEPFFWQEGIDKIISKDDLTKNWIRLWKIHGSLSWFWKEDPKSKSPKIIRIGRIDDILKESNELVIYPSKEKYDSSRKQPFIAYFDRLKNYLLSGELLFIFSGFSFSDQHINEIIFNCLRQNNRLTVLVFFYKDDEVENLHKISSSYLNLNAFGPKKGIINGNLGEWDFIKSEFKSTTEKYDHYWDETKNELTLGDFNSLVNFLIINSGYKEAIESV